MNAKQGGYEPTANAAIEQEQFGGALRQLAQASTQYSATFAQIMETNTSLTKQLKESLSQTKTLLTIINKSGGTARPNDTYNTLKAPFTTEEKEARAKRRKAWLKRCDPESYCFTCR